MIVRGSSVVSEKSYRVRVFALRPDEEPAAEFASFDRTDRPRGLYQVTAGERFVALTDANDDGQLYVRIDVGGTPHAGILLAGSYTP